MALLKRRMDHSHRLWSFIRRSSTYRKLLPDAQDYGPADRTAPSGGNCFNFFWGTALGGILGMIFGIPLTAF